MEDRTNSTHSRAQSLFFLFTNRINPAKSRPSQRRLSTITTRIGKSPTFLAEPPVESRDPTSPLPFRERVSVDSKRVCMIQVLTHVLTGLVHVYSSIPPDLFPFFLLSCLTGIRVLVRVARVPEKSAQHRQQHETLLPAKAGRRPSPSGYGRHLAAAATAAAAVSKGTERDETK